MIYTDIVTIYFHWNNVRVINGYTNEKIRLNSKQFKQIGG